MIVIVDYGMGNLGSMVNLFKKIRVEAMISCDPATIERADKLVLPGVGAFDSGMRNLESRGLVPVLNRRVVEEKVPILGVCLGMQLLCKKSEEGKLPGLAWLDAETIRFNFEDSKSQLKIPHMGWNSVGICQTNSLFGGLEAVNRFYFVHSYHVVCHNPADVLATAHHGYDFTAAFSHENIYGVQFHPEKSHRFGMALLKNFVGI